MLRIQTIELLQAFVRFGPRASFSFQKDCGGDSVEYCTRDGKHLVDCTELGYSACEQVLDDEYVARCVHQ